MEWINKLVRKEEYYQILQKNIKKILSIVVSIFIFLIFFFPFYWMLITSLKSLGEIMIFPPTLIPEVFHFENYLRAFKAISFVKYLINSCIVTFSIVILQMITVIPAAYAFSQYRFKGKKILFSTTLITMMIPSQLVFLPIFIMFSNLGLINSYISLIVPFATSAFSIFMLRQTFNQVPRALIEAAKMDNASELKIVLKIFLPIAKPTLITMALLSFIVTWNDYFWPLVMTTNDMVRTLPVGVASLRNIETGINYDLLMASNIMLTIPIIVVYLFAHKQIIKAFTYIGDK